VTLVLVVGLFIIAIGGIGVVAPYGLENIARHVTTPIGLYLAAAFRVAIGIALIRVAAASRWPRMLRCLGVIAIFAGVVTLGLGVDRARSILDWWSQQGPVFMRFWPALAVLFGVIMVLAVAPRRPAA
jgi:hypothetical protein